MKDKRKILLHYLICALWTEELDRKDIKDIAKQSVEQATKDIDAFMLKAEGLVGDMTEEMIGHDFWLTRNGHGAGFWDRGLGDVGIKLTEICKEFNQLNVFDGGKVLIE